MATKLGKYKRSVSIIGVGCTPFMRTTDPANPEYNYGLVTEEFYPRAAYVAYNTLTTLFRGKRFVSRLNPASGEARLLEFAGDGDRVLSLWLESASGNEQSILLRRARRLCDRRKGELCSSGTAAFVFQQRKVCAAIVGAFVGRGIPNDHRFFPKSLSLGERRCGSVCGGVDLSVYFVFDQTKTQADRHTARAWRNAERHLPHLLFGKLYLGVCLCCARGAHGAVGVLRGQPDFEKLFFDYGFRVEFSNCGAVCHVGGERLHHLVCFICADLSSGQANPYGIYPRE